MRKKTIGTAVAVMLLVGCVPSLRCLYDEKTLVFDPKLVGCWAEQQQQWRFEPTEDKKAYTLTITEEEGRISKLDAHLVNLDGKRFLDLSPADDRRMEQFGAWYKAHLLGVHTFLQVNAADPNLVIATMDPEKMEKLLKAQPDLLKHEIVDDRVILTASTQQLQQFLKDEKNLKAVFGEPVSLKPVKAAADEVQ